MLEDIPLQERVLTMSSFKTGRSFLLAWMIACAGTTSCKLADLQIPGDETQLCSSGKEAEKGGTKVLSQEKIIAAANKAARQRGYNPAKDYVFYDEGNAGWRYFVTRLSPPESESEKGPVWPDHAFETNLRSRWPNLESHDYQAVYYIRRMPEGYRGLVGRTWIIVDRNTGEILVVHEEPA